MRRLRKLYMAESILASQSAGKRAEREKAMQRQARERMREEIGEYKRRSKGISEFEEEGEIGADVEEALKKADAEGKGEKERREEERAVRSLGIGTGVFKKYLAERRQKRFTSHLALLTAQSQSRLSSLTYLLHSTSHFITYSNLDASIDQFLGVHSGSMTDKSVTDKSYQEYAAAAKSVLDLQKTEGSRSYAMVRSVLDERDRKRGMELQPGDSHPSPVPGHPTTASSEASGDAVPEHIQRDLLVRDEFALERGSREHVISLGGG
ncbi:hypothetical protein HK101_006903, partial [Irineochytrium annulatum]